MERVCESVALSAGAVDDSGPYPRIRNALICGRRSVHGYEYDASVWADGRAKRLYEGVAAYAGHADRDRTALKLGWWQNISLRENGQPQGDLCLNPEHPLARAVLWAAKNKPDQYAFSHVADVRKVKLPDGRIVVESIGKVFSVDLVDIGGTMNTIRESGLRGTTMLVREFANVLAPKCSVEQLLKLRSLVKEDGIGDVPMPAGAPDPAAETTTGDGGVDAAFSAVAMKEIQDCLDAKGDPARLKRCLARLKKLLMAHGELAADDVVEDSEEPKDSEEPEETARESGVDPWEIVAECEREQYRPDATDLKLLKLVRESADRLTYIRRQKGLLAATSPKGTSRETLATVKESAADTPPSGIEAARLVMATYSKELRGAN